MKEGHDEKCEDERFDMVCCCSCRAAENALAKRVEELESLILDYCGRDTSALRIQILGEAKAIAERRAGRAK